MEKTFTYEYRNFTITIFRNKRKDCFLQSIKGDVNGKDKYIILPENVFGLSLFLTLKGAKNKAIELINESCK